MKRTITTDIHATAGLQPVGLNISAGQQVTVSVVSGEWSVAPDAPASGSAGQPGSAAAPQSLFPGKPLGALVGKVGETVFLVDEDGVPDDLSGELLLGINDAPEGMADNSGALQVAIETFWPTAVVLATAAGGWQSSGLTIAPEQRVTLTARGGRWLASPSRGYCDAAGYGVTAPDGFPLPGAPEGALLGKIGRKVFAVGAEAHVPQQASGELFLATNTPDYETDHQLGHVRVEASSVAVELTVRAHPPFQSTGIMVRSSSQIVIRGTGGSSTNFPPEGSQSKAGTGAPLPAQPLGGLIGRIGNKKFLIGSKATPPAGLTGELEIGTNVPQQMRPTIVEQLYAEVDGAVPVAGTRPCLDFGPGVFVRASPALTREKFQTLSAWVRVDASGNQPIPILAGLDDKAERFTLAVNPLTATYAAGDDPARTRVVVTAPNAQPAAGEWTHVALVADGSSVHLSWGGGTRGQTSLPYDGTLETTLGHVVMGADATERTVDWAGSIAEVSIWNRALSQAELHSVASAELRGDEPGLIQYWPLSEGRGLHVQDRARLKPGMVFSPENPPKNTPGQKKQDQPETVDAEVRDTMHLWSEQILPVARTIRKRVLAGGGWQSTGVELVTPGRSGVTLVATGRDVTVGSVSGLNATGQSNSSAPESHPLPGLPIGLLVGKVGNRTFPVGAHTQVPDGVTGKLRLIVNADPSALHQNTGRFDVTITIPPMVEAVVPHPARLSGYAGTRNTALAAANRQAAGRIGDAHTQADKDIQEGHAKAQGILESGASLEVIFAAHMNGLTRWNLNRSGEYERLELARGTFTVDLGGGEEINTAPKVALDRKSRRVYWAYSNEWFPRTQFQIFSVMWDGSEQRVATVNLPAGAMGTGSVIDAMVVNPVLEKLYLIHHTVNGPNDDDYYAQSVTEHSLTNPADARDVVSFTRPLGPGTFSTANNKPVYRNENGCYLFYFGPVGFTASGKIWVIQPQPPTGEYAANSYADGDDPTTAVGWRAPIKVSRPDEYFLSGHADAAYNGKYVATEQIVGGKPVYRNADGRHLFRFGPVAFTTSGKIWVIQPSPPSGQYMANSWADGEDPVTAAGWRPPIRISRQDDYVVSGHAEAHYNGKYVATGHAPGGRVFIPHAKDFRAGPANPITTLFSAAIDPGSDRVFIAGRGGAWVVTPGKNSVSTLDLNSEWPTALEFNLETGVLYWIDALGEPMFSLMSMNAAGKITRGSQRIEGWDLAVDPEAKRAFVAMSDGIRIASLDSPAPVDQTREADIRWVGMAQQIIYEDPLADEQALMAKVVEARKTAAREKADKIATAHQQANARKAAKQVELQQAHTKADVDRRQATAEQNNKIVAKRGDLAKEHDNKNTRVAAANAKAKNDTDGALADKRRDIAAANQDAARQKDAKLAELNKKRRSR